MKIEIELPDHLFRIVKKISEDKNVSLHDLIVEDIKGLVSYYKEQYASIGLIL